MIKKRVCHLSSVHHALDTRIFYRYCLTLSEHYDVTLIAVTSHADSINGVNIIPFRRFRNKMLRVLFTWLIMFFKALKVRAVIYHIHDPELIPCGLLLKCTGKQVIFDIHENIADDIFDKPWIKNKKVLYTFFHFFEKLAVRYFKIILAEKSYEKRYIHLKSDFTTILNYPDISFFQPFIKEKRSGNRIFYIGILLESRGVAEIAAAIHLLNKKNLHVEFDVVGELYTSLYEKLIRIPYWEDVKDQIHFHGRLTLQQGYEISRNAAVGMCIIHPMKNSIDSYPTKMFEYMAIGLPQITSHFPLYKSVVEKHYCGICVNPASPEEIAAAIELLLGDTDLAEQMGKNGLSNAPEYNWNTEAVKVLKVYSDLLS